MCFPDSVVGFNANEEFSSELYMHYVFSYIRSSIQNSVSGSIQDNINIDYLTALRFKVPDRTEQDRILEVLSTLDAKIDLNNRINEELEGLAKLLYDYWFVQFDFPISADQAAAMGDPTLEGNPYRQSGGKMVYNKTLKREIPEGWRDSTLGGLYELYQPKTISESDLNPNGKYLVYGANGVVGRYDSFNHADPVVALTCRGSTCGTLNQTLPNSWITGNAMVMKPRAKHMGIDFALNQARRSGIHSIISGSGQPQITRTNLEVLKAVDPDNQVVERFGKICEPGQKQKLLLAEQNQQLTELRDWLLPMLMNGQVTVAES